MTRKRQAYCMSSSIGLLKLYHFSAEGIRKELGVGYLGGASLRGSLSCVFVCDLDFSELFHSMWLKTRRKKTLIVRTKFCDLLARCFEVLKVFATDLLMQLEPFQRF